MCVTCGREMKQGWAYQNHRKICGVVRTYEAIDDHMQAAVLEHNEQHGHCARVPQLAFDEGHNLTVEKHFTECTTLDTTQVLRYMGWGRLTLSDSELECCRFLRSIEKGGGSSDSSARASLDYARSLGGRGDLLPSTVRTCWTKINEVFITHSLYYSFPFHFIVHSQCIFTFFKLFIPYALCYSLLFISYSFHIHCTIHSYSFRYSLTYSLTSFITPVLVVGSRAAECTYPKSYLHVRSTE